MLQLLTVFFGRIHAFIPLFAAEKASNSKRQLMLLKEAEHFMQSYISSNNRLMLPVPEPVTEIQMPKQCLAGKCFTSPSRQPWADSYKN